MQDGMSVRRWSVATTQQLMVTGVFLAVIAWCRPVAACDCVEEGVWAGIDWPKDGATDVPIDTILAVGISFDDDSSVTPVLTRMADGVEVPLKRERTFQVNKCVTANEILRPTTPLDAGETYTLGFRYQTPEPDRILVPIPSHTFTTGLTVPTPAPEPELTLSYRRISASPNCKPVPHNPCVDYAEVEISATYPLVSDTPLWVSVSHGERGATATLRLTNAEPQNYTVGVPVPLDEPCVEVEAFDGFGRTLLRETLCQPEKCAVLEEGPEDTTPVRLGSASCTSGNDPLGEELWQQVASESCEDPPSFTIDYGNPDTPYVLSEQKKPASACTIGVKQTRSGVAYALIAAAMPLILRRKRRAVGNSTQHP